MGVSFSVAEGGGVVGPNGAGKTTLLLALIDRSAGGGPWKGVTEPETYRRCRRIGVVFQDPDDQLFCRRW